MTTALYRRYRPETFADVIGQEHVTAPLMSAIGTGRVSHAYLFSGPRGCGKTTSARILARCLNCANGPTPEPCGECDSCRELARGGSGSLDVVEIDAASHNGVDDARELRERAAFAPARDRFKIFILDEAHMVTAQGFNALLKLVEEPPDHVKFIFATTEPEKVIGTIRSRTHHYPFRLVPPDRLGAYLEQICAAEGVEVGSGVLPLVVRAGGGSVRDSLSVLDQLLAGAEGTLDYVQAVALLGYTPATLLDDAVEAFAAVDGASVFRVVDRVVESGQEPRRFVEDLLQRLRDLIVLVAAGERGEDALRGVPADQLERMRGQADRLGLAQLSRAADLTNAALTEMTGATSPRLQLELLCARLLLPAADEPVRGYGARIERLEKAFDLRGVRTTASTGPTAPPPSPTVASTGPTAPHPTPTAPGADRRPSAMAGEGTIAVESGAPSAAGAGSAHARPESRGPARRDSEPPARRPTGPDAGAERGRAHAPAPESAPAPAPEPEPASASAAPAPAGGMDSESVRRRWPEVLETLYRMRRTTWTITSQNAQVVELDGAVLRLRFDTPGIASTFRNGSHPAAVEQAVRETLGLQVRIDAIAADGPAAGGQGSGGRGAGGGGGRGGRAPEPARSAPGPDHAARATADWADAVAAGRPAGAAPASGAGPAPRAGSASRASNEPSSPGGRGSGASGSGGSGSGASGPGASGTASSASVPPGVTASPPARPVAAAPSEPPASEPPPWEPPPWEPPAWEPPVDEPDPDDPDLDDSSLIGAPLVEKLLGGTVIDEISLGPGGPRAPGAP